MNDFKAIISVQSDANPKFHKPRSIPFKGIGQTGTGRCAKRVNFSEWASPIVAVPKKDGQFCVC